MKAMVRETYGPPDVLRPGDVPAPTNGDDEVLVRVQAASANAGVWRLLRGTPLPFRLVAGLIKPKYKVIGNDIAGTVEAVGRNATQFTSGCCPQRVDPRRLGRRRHVRGANRQGTGSGSDGRV